MIVGDGEYIDFSKVPESKGIGTPAFIVLAVGLIGIFVMGYLSVIMSGFGHMWPAPKTMRMDLGNMPTQSSTSTTP